MPKPQPTLALGRFATTATTYACPWSLALGRLPPCHAIPLTIAYRLPSTLALSRTSTLYSIAFYVPDSFEVTFLVLFFSGTYFALLFPYQFHAALSLVFSLVV